MFVSIKKEKQPETKTNVFFFGNRTSIIIIIGYTKQFCVFVWEMVIEVF